MDFIHTVAYNRLLAKGIDEVNKDFRRLAKLNPEDRFDAMLELAGEMIERNPLDPACFARAVHEMDEFEYELHMTLQADLDNYLSNEVADLIRLKNEIVF